MSDFLEIGEIVEAIPNPITVIPEPATARVTKTTANTIKAENYNWLWTALLVVVVGGTLIYYKTKKDENTNISDES